MLCYEKYNLDPWINVKICLLIHDVRSKILTIAVNNYFLLFIYYRVYKVLRLVAGCKSLE